MLCLSLKFTSHIGYEETCFGKAKFLDVQTKAELFNYYFDNEVDGEIFRRAARKCYYPSNQIILDVMDRHKHSRRQAKFSFSLSGVFLEQCEMFDKDLLETFQQLAASGCVEFLDQTYYHSIASLYPEKEEFIDQVKMHQQIIKDLLGYTPHSLKTLSSSTTTPSPKPSKTWATKASTPKA